jgi:peptide/nickel transport system permease protein
MLGYLIRRLLSGIVALLVFVSLVFFLTQLLVSVDFVDLTLPLGTSASVRDQVREDLGLDRPLGERYADYMLGLMQGDLGTSYGGYSVAWALSRVTLPTLLVFVPGVVLAFTIGNYLGGVTAWRGRSLFSDGVTLLGITAYAFFPPALVFVLDQVFVNGLHISPENVDLFWDRLRFQNPDIDPVTIYRDMLIGFAGATIAVLLINFAYHRLRHRSLSLFVTLPLGFGLWVITWAIFGSWTYNSQVATLILIPVFGFTLLTLGDMLVVSRTSISDVLYEEYINTARAKGLSDRDVRTRHAMRSALLPIASKAVISLPYLLTGLAIIEYSLRWGGIGSTLFGAMGIMDIPLVMGCLIAAGILSLFARIVLDVLVLYLDPRLRSSAAY